MEFDKPENDQFLDQHPAKIEYLLKPGYIVVHQAPAVVYMVLGSAVAVSIWDRQLSVGGVCHYQYPCPPEGDEPTARYGTVALPKLLKMLLECGAAKENLQAQIFGGADQPGQSFGAKNLEVASDWLQHSGLRVVSTDVGGEKGRKVMYNVNTNEAVILQANRIRTSDWYPYQDER